MISDEPRRWAEEEFGRAELGHDDRVARLVRMAETVAARPGGKITDVFRETNERKAAYSWLRNPDAESADVGYAASRACAARCRDEAIVVVPIDGSSLNITDTQATKGTGPIGTRTAGARGFEVMTALVLTLTGIPVGIGGQVYWARAETPVTVPASKRPLEEKETRYWLEVQQQVETAFHHEQITARPWYQLDRGGDCNPVLLRGLEPGTLFTVRANVDRCLAPADASDLATTTDAGRLWTRLTHEAPAGHRSLVVPPTPTRTARVARVAVRFAQVSVRLCDSWSGRHLGDVTLYAVWACEVSAVPAGQDRIEWMLLTTYPVLAWDDACEVIDKYALRWRVEDFHRAWKSGICHVEATQLRSAAALIKWARLLASVAVRALRLIHLARQSPDLPAGTEFTQDEVDGAIVLRGPDKTSLRRGATLTLGAMIALVADLGGYTGPGSGGPPGPDVLMRGLRDVEVATVTLRHLLQMLDTS